MELIHNSKEAKMKDHLYSPQIHEEKIYIGDIPALLFRPKDKKESLPTIVFYHGWSSNKEAQRIRGLIFAAVGYQVLIPDAIYHGERNPIEYTMENSKYFWEIILNNVKESFILINELTEKYGGDPENIFVMGNSMGGFTASGVFTQNKNIKSLVVFNGSCAWEFSNEKFKENPEIKVTADMEALEAKIKELDPINNMEKLKDRPILMLHGDSDVVVSVEAQREFFQKINPLYEDKNKIKLLKYPGLNHYITTNMIEESILWIGK